MVTTAAADKGQGAEASLRWGSWLRGSPQRVHRLCGALLVRNFTDSFLELGIGPHEVPVGKDAIQQFSPELFHYISHLHIAVSGFIAATGLAVLFLAAYGVRRGELWAWVGRRRPGSGGGGAAGPLPQPLDTLGHLGLIYLATVIFVAERWWRYGGSSPSVEAESRRRARPFGRPRPAFRTYRSRKGTGRCKHQQPCCAPSAARPPTAGDAPSAGRSPASTTPATCTSAPTATARCGAPAAGRPTSTALCSCPASGQVRA